MERYTGSQYDDDLTVGMDELDDSLQTGDVDLFEYVSDEESPITRLKTIILSIDWEITDDILRQFNVELLDLKDIWANDKIKLVYVQALEKVSKYIYKEKSNANPNAIKLLLTFYTNLEKIVTNESMPEEDKKALLLADVEKFEKLKKQISRLPGKPQVDQAKTEKPFTSAPQFRIDEPLPSEQGEDPLLNLKAIVFGMDWEITQEDLLDLGEEVRKLEKQFANSKAKLIFLQGIGAIGAYINLKRSNAHADAFKLLHSFFLSLENCVRNGLTGDEEKKVLLPEVEKFNAFKSAIASTISPEAIAASDIESEEETEEEYFGTSEEIAPAFADMPEDIHGFQEEEQAVSIEGDMKQKMDGRIESFFDGEKSEQEPIDKIEGAQKKNGLIEEMESRLDRFFGENDEKEIMKTSAEDALQGVDVETEADDDSGEDALPREAGGLAPALSDNFEESAFSEQDVADELATVSSEQEESPVIPSVDEGPPAALEGVQVETEADDDSDEEPLPMSGEGLAPALFSIEEEVGHGGAEVSDEEETLVGIEERLDKFFNEEPGQLPSTDSEEMELNAEDTGREESVGGEGTLSLEGDIAQPGIYPEKEEEEDFRGGEPVAALPSDFEEDTTGEETKEELTPPAQEEKVLSFDEEEVVAPPEEEVAIDLEEEIVAPLAEEELALDLEEEVAASPEEEELAIDFEEEVATPPEEEVSFGLGEEVAAIAEGEDAMADSEEETEALTLDEDVFLEEEEQGTGIFTATEESLSSEEDTIEVAEEEIETEAEEVPFVEEEVAYALDEETSIADAGTEEVFPEEGPHVAYEEHLEEILEDEETRVELLAEDEIGPALMEEKQAHEEEILSEEGLIEATADVEEEGVLEPNVEEMDLGAEEAGTPAEEEQTPVFTVAEEGVPSGTDAIEELDEYIEYIEGVEFDSEIEPEADFAPEVSEDVVFKPAEEERGAESEEEEKITFGEVEAELDRYLAEQVEEDEQSAEIGKVETFGQEIEKGLSDSEIRMEVFPEPDTFEGIADSELDDLLRAEEPEEEEVVFTAVDDLDAETEDKDPLSDLREYVMSLGMEINDDIEENLLIEINRLHDKWITKPVEKIFLQLLSTVANHIDQYRDNTSPEAHGLLMSIFNKLELARLTGADSVEVQEGLLAETSKILLWQQRLLSTKALEPAEDFTAVFEEAGEDAELDALPFEADVEHFSREKTLQKEESSPERLDTSRITQIVRDELESMRRSFREEMGELLRLHLDKKSTDTNEE